MRIWALILALLLGIVLAGVARAESTIYIGSLLIHYDKVSPTY